MIPRRPLLLILSELIRWVKALTRLGLRLPLEEFEVAVKSLWRLQRGWCGPSPVGCGSARHVTISGQPLLS